MHKPLFNLASNKPSLCFDKDEIHERNQAEICNQETMEYFNPPRSRTIANGEELTANLNLSHDQAFVEDPFSNFSPICNISPVTLKGPQLTTSSTPFTKDELAPTVRRSVKRRTSRLSSRNQSKRTSVDSNLLAPNEFKTELKIEELLTVNHDWGDSLLGLGDVDLKDVNCNNTPKTSDGNKDEHICELETINNIIEVSDSLQVAADFNSALMTTADEILFSNECNTTMDVTMIKKTDDANNFFGLPLKVKEILKSQRGINNVYGMLYADRLNILQKKF